MRLSQNSELISTLNTEVDTAMNDHKVKVKRGKYRLKRDESAGLSYVRGIEHLLNMIGHSVLTGAILARLLLKERDFWKDVRDERRVRYAQGNALVKDVIGSDAFYDGVQHAMSIVLEYTVMTAEEDGVVSV